MVRVFAISFLALSLGVFSASAVSADCAGDLNGDGVVDASDDEILKAQFGAQSGEANYTTAADLDGDGVIGGTDYLALQRAKGQCS